MHFTIVLVPLQVVLHGQSTFPVTVSHMMFTPIRIIGASEKVFEAIGHSPAAQ